MSFQKVTCGKKVTCDNLYVRSLTQPLTPSQRDWLAESRDAAAWILVRGRFGHEHGLSDYIGPCIPEGPIRHKHAVGVSALQQASMPRERLRSIPRESATQRLSISHPLRLHRRAGKIAG